MSVLIETSKGDIVVDLYVRHAPYACFNFLKCARAGRQGARVGEETKTTCDGRSRPRDGETGTPTKPRLRRVLCFCWARFDKQCVQCAFVFHFHSFARRLCKLKYYNDCLFFNVQRRFVVQTGDPKNDGTGGQSVWGVLRDAGYGEGPRGFADESVPAIKHSKRGLLCMAGGGASGDAASRAGSKGDPPEGTRKSLPPLIEYTTPDGARRSLPMPPASGPNGSQFFFQTALGSVPSLDSAGCVPFGEVVEGLSVLATVDESACDSNDRPLQNVRIRHTLVLDDPFADLPGLGALVPAESPRARFADDGRLEDDWDALLAAQEQRELRQRRGGGSDDEGGDDGGEGDDEEKDAGETRAAERASRASGLSDEAREAHNRAVVLEMLGDLPSADVAPPETVLFVCRLNPATAEEDLDLIFGRYGEITSCSIPRDPKTGESLRYAFVGFASKEAAETAYLKMNNVIIDERRIRVDFSQSVAGLWRHFHAGKAVEYDEGRSGGGATRARGRGDRGSALGGGGRRRSVREGTSGAWEGGDVRGAVASRTGGEGDRLPPAPRRDLREERRGAWVAGGGRRERRDERDEQEQSRRGGESVHGERRKRIHDEPERHREHRDQSPRDRRRRDDRRWEGRQERDDGNSRRDRRSSRDSSSMRERRSSRGSSFERERKRERSGRESDDRDDAEHTEKSFRRGGERDEERRRQRAKREADARHDGDRDDRRERDRDEKHLRDGNAERSRHRRSDHRDADQRECAFRDERSSRARNDSGYDGRPNRRDSDRRR